MELDLPVLLTIQVLYITPLFWLMELLQNQFFRVAINGGSWGWQYPESRHVWFSFWSLLLWAGTVTVFLLLHRFVFEPMGTSLLVRVVVAGTIGWTGEYVAGYLAANVLKRPLQIWNFARWRFVRPIALPFWMANVLLYYLLTRHMDGSLTALASR